MLSRIYILLLTPKGVSNHTFSANVSLNCLKLVKGTRFQIDRLWTCSLP